MNTWRCDRLTSRECEYSRNKINGQIQVFHCIRHGALSGLISVAKRTKSRLQVKVNFAGVFSTNTPNYSACATSYRPFTHRLCCACALLRCADTTRSVRMNAPLQLTERFMRPHVTTFAQLPREKLISCASESAPVLAVTEYQA